MARPTIATSNLTEKVATLVRAGNRPIAAAGSVGVAQSTFYLWMRRGRRAEALEEDGHDVPTKERPFLEFMESVVRAEAESEVLAVTQIRSQWGRSANAAIAWLERRFPKEWSRTERREHSGPDSGPIEVAEGPRQRIERRLARIGQRLLEEAVAAEESTDEKVQGGEAATGPTGTTG